MVQAIDASTTTASTSASTATKTNSAASAGALQAQLAQYQRQLSDCVNCSSANTPEGKQQIAEISGKINALKQTIEASQATPSPETTNAHTKQTHVANHATTSNPVTATEQATGVNPATQSAQATPNQLSSGLVRPTVAANLTIGVNVNLYS